MKCTALNIAFCLINILWPSNRDHVYLNMSLKGSVFRPNPKESEEIKSEARNIIIFLPKNVKIFLKLKYQEMFIFTR